MVQKIVCLVGNERIERSIKAFWREKDNLLLLQAFDAIRQRMNEDGHFLIPVDSQIQTTFQKVTHGEQNVEGFLPVFTTMTKVKDGPQCDVTTQHIAIVLETVLSDDSAVGIIVNPWSESLFLSKAAICQILEDNIKMGDGRRIIVQKADKETELHIVSNLQELESYYEHALAATNHDSDVDLPAFCVDDTEPEIAAYHTARFLFDWLDASPKRDTTIVLRCANQEQLEWYDSAVSTVNAERAALRFQLEEMRDKREVARSTDWDCKPMPQRNLNLCIERSLSNVDIEVLRYVNIPKAQEDKWFWYVDENDILYAHRSWSGNCIFKVFLSDYVRSAGELLRVTINNDEKQCEWAELDDAIEELQYLLNWWTQLDYDYRGEWLDERRRAKVEYRNEEYPRAFQFYYGVPIDAVESDDCFEHFVEPEGYGKY